MTIHKWNLAPILIAIGLVVASAISLSANHLWGKYLYEFILAFGGCVAFLFSDTFAEFTGGYGWTRSQWWQQPDWYVRIVGGVMLLYGANEILDLM